MDIICIFLFTGKQGNVITSLYLSKHIREDAWRISLYILAVLSPEKEPPLPTVSWACPRATMLVVVAERIIAVSTGNRTPVIQPVSSHFTGSCSGTFNPSEAKLV
jgi:hypothetical protein